MLVALHLAPVLRKETEEWRYPLWTFEGGYTVLNADNSDASLGGYIAQISYEDVTSFDLAGGVTIGYMVTATETDTAGAEYSYSSLPFTVQGKYLFSRHVPFYWQAGIGIHFSKLERTTEVRYNQYSDVGAIIN